MLYLILVGQEDRYQFRRLTSPQMLHLRERYNALQCGILTKFCQE